MEHDDKNDVNPIMTSERLSLFVCWLLCAQHKNLAILMFLHVLSM